MGTLDVRHLTSRNSVVPQWRPATFTAEVHQYLEGWRAESEEIVPEPDGEGIEPAVRVRVRGSEGFEVFHEFAKDELAGARFPPRLRAEIGWVFDERARDPSRALAFFQRWAHPRTAGLHPGL